MKNEEWLVILNPFAAGGKAKRKQKLVEEHLQKSNLTYSIVVSQSREHTVELVRNSLDDGYRKFGAVGGDGTMNSLVNAIYSQSEIPLSEIQLALIPIGTGNDWIKAHNIPKSIQKSIEIIARGKTALHDVGEVKSLSDKNFPTRYFINLTGAGFEGFVAERIEVTNKSLKMGIASFILGIVDALFRYKTTSIKVDINNEIVEGKIFTVAVGICPCAGGGMRLAPDAITDDGLFDVTVAGNLSRWEVIRNVPRLYNGSFVKNKKISRYRANRISIRSNEKLPIETDGEVLGNHEVEIRIHPEKICVIVP